MVLPQKRVDLCTLFLLPALTQPASPLMHKMVLEYHFEHFVLLLSAALILVSVQSVSPNPLMNVFFWSFTWQHIPTLGQWTAGWLHRMFYFIRHCQTHVCKAQLIFIHISNDSSQDEWRHKLQSHRQAFSHLSNHEIYVVNFLYGYSYITH